MFKALQLLINSMYNGAYFSIMRMVANHRHNITGRQYHVIPIGGRLRIIDNVDHGAVNRLAKKYGVPKMTYKQLLERSYYSTSLKR